jgi:pimeloyl-ACP methyl ester carboxylesterase
MRTATVNGFKMAYRDLGQKHPRVLLLIHGFPLDHRMWAAQIAGLPAGVRVIAPDLRGHGQSPVTPGPYSMEGHADDLAALLDHLGVKRAVVAGLSMGGYVAFAFWRRHPARVAGLALLDTRAEPDGPQAREARNAAIARVPQIGAAAYAEEMLPRLVAPLGLADPRIAGAARAIMASQPVEGALAALGALRDRPDSRPTLATITVPTLVVVGEMDAVTPPADAAAMTAAIPGAHMVVVPRAGHLSPLENARFVNRQLRAFTGALPV